MWEEGVRLRAGWRGGHGGVALARGNPRETSGPLRLRLNAARRVLDPNGRPLRRRLLAIRGEHRGNTQRYGRIVYVM